MTIDVQNRRLTVVSARMLLTGAAATGQQDSRTAFLFYSRAVRNVLLGVRLLALAAVILFVVTLVTGKGTEAGVVALVGAVVLVVVVGIVDLVVRRRHDAGVKVSTRPG